MNLGTRKAARPLCKIIIVKYEIMFSPANQHGKI
jgi:hypothetical protein